MTTIDRPRTALAVPDYTDTPQDCLAGRLLVRVLRSRTGSAMGAVSAALLAALGIVSDAWAQEALADRLMSGDMVGNLMGRLSTLDAVLVLFGYFIFKIVTAQGDIPRATATHALWLITALAVVIVAARVAIFLHNAGVVRVYLGL